MSKVLRTIWPDAYLGAGDEFDRPHGNCYWLARGRVLCGEHPGMRDDPACVGHVPLTTRLRDLQDAGVSCLVDLTTPADPVPAYEVLPACGFTGVRLSSPIADFGVPTIEQMQSLVEDIDAQLSGGRLLYVHCRAGIGRTGTVAASLLVSAGFSAERALTLLQAKWQCVDKRFQEPRTPETDAQRAFVDAWERHLGTCGAGR